MKQTAVEWLENQIKTSKYSYKLMEDINSRSTVAQPNIFEQAKEMEKEQQERSYSEEDMREAFIAGGNSQIEEDDDYGTEYDAYMEEWFEQFKKK
jgi:hypothetical protein